VQGEPAPTGKNRVSPKGLAHGRSEEHHCFPKQGGQLEDPVAREAAQGISVGAAIHPFPVPETIMPKLRIWYPAGEYQAWPRSRANRCEWRPMNRTATK
jgi:hypothetical protein